ncbi:suppressor of fused domain protein [Dietzia sp.]|uniref:suppressor of fused domain protein n=1 Tax=Dietzia sp. TaxID=1871616 RepID=UPI002FD90E11
MSPSVLDAVRARLDEQFSAFHRDEAQVTFLGNEPMRLVRYAPLGGSSSGSGSAADDVVWYCSLGCSSQPMDPSTLDPDPSGPRAELVLGVRRGVDAVGKTLAMLAASPSIEGVVLREDFLLDLENPLWPGSAFTAVILIPSGIEPARGEWGADVEFFQAVPVTQTEAAWVRLKGAGALREAWEEAGIDVLDPDRSAVQPGD